MADAREKPEVESSVADELPDTIATPEGDNEYAPGQPLPAGTEPPVTRPRGDEPHSQQPERPALN
jgi:hypothetical protein